MSFFRELVVAVYAHYRKRNESMAAAFHSRIVISLVCLIYFTVLFLFLQRMTNIQVLSSLDIMKDKLTYIGALIVIYILVHLVGGSNKQLEENYTNANKGIKTTFFIFSILGIIALFFTVPYLSSLRSYRKFSEA